MVDHIKSFGKINYIGHCVESRTKLVKALSYFTSGVVGTDAKLVG